MLRPVEQYKRVNDWTRAERLAAWSIIVAIIGVAATLFFPELRRFLGVRDRPLVIEIASPQNIPKVPPAELRPERLPQNPLITSDKTPQRVSGGPRLQQPRISTIP